MLKISFFRISFTRQCRQCHMTFAGIFPAGVAVFVMLQNGGGHALIQSGQSVVFRCFWFFHLFRIPRIFLYRFLTGDPQSDSFVIPFKNLINDSYCKDISMKIRSSLEVKQKNGEFVGAFAPYGYTFSSKAVNGVISIFSCSAKRLATLLR